MKYDSAEFSHVKDTRMREFLVSEGGGSLDVCGRILDTCVGAFLEDEKNDLIDRGAIKARREALDEMYQALGDRKFSEFREAVRNFWRV